LASEISARARAGQIVRRPGLVLLLVSCGAMLVVAATAVGASSAYFTASSNESGSVAAGSVELAVVPASEIVDLSDLQPGDSRSGPIEVTNTANEATVTLGIADLQQSPPTVGLDEILDVVVQETSPGQSVRFTGKLHDLHGVALGTLGPDEHAAFVITVAWPVEEDDPVRQGTTADFVFEVYGVST
jgi:hypothetical protein